MNNIGTKAITIRFKLHGQAADLARALHDFLRYKEHIDIPLDEVVKRQFIGWMQKNVVAQGEGTSDGELTEAAQTQAVPTGDQPEEQATTISDPLLSTAKES